MTRLYNFCAGPAALPTAVLTQAQTDLLNWQQKGLSIMEMSHRSPEFVGIAQKAEQDLRDLMVIPDNYKVLFMQGGASSQFTMIPMNLLRGKKTADYINTGQWSKKAIAEAKRFCDVNVAATTEGNKFTSAPSQEELNLFIAIAEITGRHYRQLLRAEKSEHTLSMIKQGRSEFENIALITLTLPNLEIISISDDAISFLSDNRDSEDLSVYSISSEMTECINSWLTNKKAKPETDHRVVFELNAESQLLLELWHDESRKTLSILITPYQRHWSTLLSPRLLEVMDGLARGLTNKEISTELFISTRTVEKHCYNIYKTLKLEGRWDAIHLAISSPDN